MANKAKYLMIASMDVDPEHEAVFNEVYDKEHVPNLNKVPGVLGITRYKRGTLTMNIGGERKTIEIPNEPVYTAIYELESPDGRFQVRKHTIAVQPAQRVSFLVTADAPGRWAWHCHLLYHMDMGMFREVVVA